MTFLSQRVYDDILLLVQHFMGEVNITVDCTISGRRDEFVYDTENTLYKFIEDLQEVGMAWAKEHQPHGAGIMVDGRSRYPILPKTPTHPFSMDNGNELGITLHDLGVKSGSHIVIQGDVAYCGPGSLPIVFYCTEGIEYPSPNWGQRLHWINGDSLTGIMYGSGCIWEVLPKKVERESVYVTLHGYGKNGQIKTFLENRSLNEINQMTFHEYGSVYGWICFVFSKSQRRKLGS
jgi:hypothetical protein